VSYWARKQDGVFVGDRQVLDAAGMMRTRQAEYDILVAQLEGSRPSRPEKLVFVVMMCQTNSPLSFTTHQAVVDLTNDFRAPLVVKTANIA